MLSNVLLFSILFFNSIIYNIIGVYGFVLNNKNIVNINNKLFILNSHNKNARNNKNIKNKKNYKNIKYYDDETIKFEDSHNIYAGVDERYFKEEFSLNSFDIYNIKSSNINFLEKNTNSLQDKLDLTNKLSNKNKNFRIQKGGLLNDWDFHMEKKYVNYKNTLDNSHNQKIGNKNIKNNNVNDVDNIDDINDNDCDNSIFNLNR